METIPTNLCSINETSFFQNKIEIKPKINRIFKIKQISYSKILNLINIKNAFATLHYFFENKKKNIIFEVSKKNCHL